jgi:hypothetical protein
MKNHLTTEQNRAMDRAALRFVWRFFFTVSTHVITFSLAVFSLFSAVFFYLDGNPALDLFGSFLISYFVSKNAFSNIRRDFAQLETTVKAILKK